MIAVLGAFTTFVVDKRITGLLFWLIIGGSFLCFVWSIFAGGKGIKAATDKGFGGTWDLLASKKWFNGQALACIVGLILFGAALVVSSTKDDPTERALTSMASNIGTLTANVTEVNAQRKVDEQQRLAQLEQTLRARQDAFESTLRKDLPMLERLEKEQQHLEALESLEKTVADLQKGQSALNDAVRDLKVQIVSRKNKK
jgi:hypothetical protein